MKWCLHCVLTADWFVHGALEVRRGKQPISVEYALSKSAVKMNKQAPIIKGLSCPGLLPSQKWSYVEKQPLLSSFVNNADDINI